MKRFPFLDWMRGLAVLIMIQCHTFNSFAAIGVREEGTYVLSQFVGGMAAPLFLFMAGMTFGFQMEGLDRRQPRAADRWLAALRRGAYILAIAYLFRFSNCVASIPRTDWNELTKVDILNCMGLGMIVFSAAAAVHPAARIRVALLSAVSVAALSPVVAHLPWGNTPALIQEYLAAGQGRGRFAFFPCAAYIGFGMAAGAVVRRAALERFERLMQWAVLIGFALVFSGQYFSNIPYSIYPRSNFWTDSPALIFIRIGIALLVLAVAFLWTEYGARARWSWMQMLGRHSLLVYWVHVMLVYGDILKPVKRALTIPQTVLATAVVAGSMVALSSLVERVSAVTRRGRQERLAA